MGRRNGGRFSPGRFVKRAWSARTPQFRGAGKIGVVSGAAGAALGVAGGFMHAKGNAISLHAANTEMAGRISGKLRAEIASRKKILQYTLRQLETNISSIAAQEGINLGVSGLRAMGKPGDISLQVDFDGEYNAAAQQVVSPLLEKYAVLIGEIVMPGHREKKFLQFQAELGKPVKPDHAPIPSAVAVSGGLGIAAGLGVSLIGHFSHSGVKWAMRYFRRFSEQQMPGKTIHPPAGKSPPSSAAESQIPNSGLNNGLSAKAGKGGLVGAYAGRKKQQELARLRLSFLGLATRERVPLTDGQLNEIVQLAYSANISPRKLSMLARFLPRREVTSQAQPAPRRRGVDPSFSGLRPITLSDMKRFLLRRLDFTQTNPSGGHAHFEGLTKSGRPVKVTLRNHPGHKEKVIPVNILAGILRRLEMAPQEFEKMRRGE